MMLCSRCKKRPAVVLITAMQGNQKKNEGLCLVCAKELNIPQVDEYMKQMGISDEELDQILLDRATAAGYDTIEEYIGETSKEDYREYFLYDKVTDYLVENAKITNN